MVTRLGMNGNAYYVPTLISVKTFKLRFFILKKFEDNDESKPILYKFEFVKQTPLEHNFIQRIADKR